MEMKNAAQALKLQKELSAKLSANLDKLRSEKGPTLAATVKEQEELIAEAKTELANSEKARKISLKNWDTRIKQRQATVDRLEKGLTEMKRKLEEMKKGGRKRAAESKEKTTTKPRRKS